MLLSKYLKLFLSIYRNFFYLENVDNFFFLDINIWKWDIQGSLLVVFTVMSLQLSKIKNCLPDFFFTSTLISNVEENP